MGRHVVLAFFLALSAAISGSIRQSNVRMVSQSVSSSGAGHLVGTWRLISRAVRLENGTVVQDQGLGTAPQGYLIYDASGHMAVQLMKHDRPQVVDCGTSSFAPANNSQAVNGYDAYFGTYSVDEANHNVTHNLEGAIAAADVGKSLVRHFQLSDNKLMIEVHTTSPQGKQVRVLTWERVH